MRRLPLLVVLLVLVSACASTDDGDGFEGRVLETPRPIPDVTLTTTDGEPYNIAERAAGKITLVYFGYTFCPDICPIHLNQLENVTRRPDQPDNVEVVFITVDPARDDARRVADYLGAIDDEFVGLVGTPQELVEAQRAFGAIVAVRESDDENYTMGHDGRVFAFAPDGLSYTEYPHPTRQSAWANDLPLLATLRPAA